MKHKLIGEIKENEITLLELEAMLQHGSKRILQRVEKERRPIGIFYLIPTGKFNNTCYSYAWRTIQEALGMFPYTFLENDSQRILNGIDFDRYEYTFFDSWDEITIQG